MPNKDLTTFKTELFSKLVANQPLTSATEGSITNVKRVLDPPLVVRLTLKRYRTR